MSSADGKQPDRHGIFEAITGTAGAFGVTTGESRSRYFQAILRNRLNRESEAG